ncbi:MAG: ribosome maturation factor RimM, partial [Candidatus Geothermincolia bacterium]
MSDEDSTPGGEELLAVGKILRPHGIRGALVVEPLTDWPERFAAGSKLLLEKSPSELALVTVESGGPHKGRFLVALEGTTDRDGAEALKGLYLMIRACDASPLGEGEYWVHELAGMKVAGEDGETLGEVIEVLCRAAQDLMLVR